jgi:hypothetical protein
MMAQLLQCCDWHMPDFFAVLAADLDAAFARVSTDNYRELLAKHQGSLYVPEPAADDFVYRILTAERDAIMAHSLRAVADVEGPSKTIVAVVGELLISEHSTPACCEVWHM